jgi:hypothetical protein
MVKIKYVGLKTDGERAFKELTGIEWFPGDVKEVSDEHAKVMLRHGDVFAQAGGESVKPSKAEPKLQRIAADDMTADDEAIDREEAARKAKQDAQKQAKVEGEGEGKPAQEAAPPAPAKKASKPAAKSAAKKAKK